MANQSDGKRSGIGINTVFDKPPVAEKSNPSTIKYEPIRSRLGDAHLIYYGAVTGAKYEWEQGGQVVSVNSLDVPDLLSKFAGGDSCCGGGRVGGNQIFEIAV